MATRARDALRVFFFGLALAVVLAQTLGLMHGVMHGNVHSSLAEQAEQSELASGSDDHDHDHDHDHSDSWVERLFGSHGDESDCRVYDQLSHGDAAPATAGPTLPLSLTPFVFSLLPGLAVARWHALFQARGPPNLR